MPLATESGSPKPTSPSVASEGSPRRTCSGERSQHDPTPPNITAEATSNPNITLLFNSSKTCSFMDDSEEAFASKT